MFRRLIVLTVIVASLVTAGTASARQFPPIPPSCSGPSCTFTGGGQVIKTVFECRYLSARTPIYVCTTGRHPVS